MVESEVRDHVCRCNANHLHLPHDLQQFPAGCSGLPVPGNDFRQTLAHFLEIKNRLRAVDEKSVRLIHRALACSPSAFCSLIANYVCATRLAPSTTTTIRWSLMMNLLRMSPRSDQCSITLLRYVNYPYQSKTISPLPEISPSLDLS